MSIASIIDLIKFKALTRRFYLNLIKNYFLNYQYAIKLYLLHQKTVV
jgi:hypothetical protein